MSEAVPRLNRPSRVRRTLNVLGLVLVIVVGWFVAVRCLSPLNRVRDLSAPGLSSPVEPAGSFTVAAWNIAHGRGGVFGASKWDGGSRKDKQDRIRAMAALMNEQGVDILVLNEADFSAIWSGQFDQAKLFAETADLPALVEQRNVDCGSCFVNVTFGNAILSRYPITHSEAVVFPALHPSERILGGNHDAVLCTIALPGGQDIQVLGVHLEVRDAATRERCAKQILELQQRSDLPLIVAGDFNSTPDGQAMTRLMDSGVFRARPEAPFAERDFTFPSEKPARIIDWILATEELEFLSHQVVASDLSDHLPVVAELRLK